MIDIKPVDLSPTYEHHFEDWRDRESGRDYINGYDEGETYKGHEQAN